MSQSAHVESIDHLKRLQEALARFRVDAQTALEGADKEIRHVQDELEQRRKYWQQQVIKRQEEMAQARAALSHARALREGSSVGCAEQEIAFRKAQQRVRDAEDKVLTVRRWQRELPNATKEFERAAAGLSGFIETDLRQAVAQLENKIATLEAYAAVAVPAQPKEPS